MFSLGLRTQTYGLYTFAYMQRYVQTENEANWGKSNKERKGKLEVQNKRLDVERGKLEKLENKGDVKFGKGINIGR